MNIKDIAKRIPDEVRSKLIFTDGDIIFNAIPSKNNLEMKILLRIWHEFVEPDKEVSDCPICIGNVLKNFKQMKDILFELEQDYRKLKAL